MRRPSGFAYARFVNLDPETRTLEHLDHAFLHPDYSEAIRLQPNAAVLRANRGFVYLLQGDYQSAVKDEDEAIRVDPKSGMAHLFRRTDTDFKQARHLVVLHDPCAQAHEDSQKKLDQRRASPTFGLARTGKLGGNGEMCLRGDGDCG